MNELARTYEVVFAGPPWNEYKKCSGDACDKSFGLEARGQDLCPCPNEAMLTPFYPRTETLASIAKEVNKAGAVVEVQKNETGKTIGFVWGFPTTVESFLEEKYKTEKGRDSVRNVLSENGITDTFFYFSETGVVPEYRGQGMSNMFANIMVNAAAEKGLPLVMRTNSESPMVAVAKRFDMQQVLGPFVIADRGVLYPTGAIQNALDQENTGRVLYIKTSVPKS
ncbi:MAG: hypothetical protein KA035_00210 [Candidatus Levybacteria bacterium]|nr:hypothetical protein [Candidatus Levybacteria bacterium]